MDEQKPADAAASSSPPPGDVEEEEEEEEETSSSSNEHLTKKAEKEEEELIDGASNTNDNDNDDDNSNNTEKDPTERIVEALSAKEEGNNFFKSGELDRASRSYRRGTNALKGLLHDEGDAQVRSLLLSLQTNLSLVCLKQGKVKMSRDVASKALEVDSENVKALYRRAVANRSLGDDEKARSDLKMAIKFDPTNKEVRREIISLKKVMEEKKKKERESFKALFQGGAAGGSGLYDDKEEELKQKEKEKEEKKKADAEALKKRKLQWEDECVRRMTDNEEPISYEDWDKEQKKKEKKEQEAAKKARKEAQEAKRREREMSRKAQSNNYDDDDDISDEELLKDLKKGYKLTSDGRTTSYFNRELSAEEKQLIGDIAPKRLEDCQTQSSAAGTTTKTDSASAWNMAGTWEEKDTTVWCQNKLKSRLNEPAAFSSQFCVLTEAVENISGDASIAFANGKKAYIFDFSAEIKFKIQNSEDGEDDVVASGHLKLIDVNSAHADGSCDMETSWSKGHPTEFCTEAKHCYDDYISSVRQSIQNFVADFNAQY